MDHQPLSFGIEFELALFFLSSPTPDPHPTDGRVVRGLDTTDYVPNPPNPDIHPNYFENVEGYVGDDVRVRTNIANTLQTAGLRARVELWGISDEADEDMRTIPYDTTQAETKWSVSTDPTILAELEPYDRAQIEITSPALMFSPAALNDVQLVCETITSKYRTIINKSCGLHVHVGSRDTGFDLSTCQFLFSFLYLFDPILSQLHPHSRVGEPTDTNTAHWCRPLRTDCRLASCYGRVGLAGQLRAILGTTKFEAEENKPWDMTNLANLWGSAKGGKMAYKFENLSYSGHYKRTVEFRQHAGTLDPVAVNNWVKVCVGIVSFVSFNSKSFLTEFLFDHIQREEVKTQIDVLRLLSLIGLDGLDSPAEYYRRRGPAEKAQGEPIIFEESY